MADLDPNEHTIDELRDELDGIDDPDALREIRETEADGEDREGAKDAIDERLAALDEENGDGTDTGDAAGETASGESGAGIVEVRNHIRDSAAALIGRPLDGIVEIERTEDGWRALVEIIERRSVPDTQDIIGRYAIEMDEGAAITGYRRLDRYRRGDTRSDEESASATF